MFWYFEVHCFVLSCIGRLSAGQGTVARNQQEDRHQQQYGLEFEAADKEKKVLSSIKLDSAIVGSAVAANGVVYVPTMKSLYAIQKTTP